MYNKFEAKNIANDKVGNYQDNKRRDSRLLCLYGMFCFINVPVEYRIYLPIYSLKNFSISEKGIMSF